MRDDTPPPAPGNLPTTLTGLGLLAAAGGLFAFTSGFVVQAFTGPRTITEQDLRQTTAPGWWDHYVSYTPPRPMIDTQLQWGKKGNPGTKYLLLPVGDRVMLCSARIANDGPTFAGRLEPFGGSVEEEVIDRVSAANPGLRQRLLPVQLQAVRHIWFDTAASLAGVVGLGAGGL